MGELPSTKLLQVSKPQLKKSEFLKLRKLFQLSNKHNTTKVFKHPRKIVFRKNLFRKHKNRNHSLLDRNKTHQKENFVSSVKKNDSEVEKITTEQLEQMEMKNHENQTSFDDERILKSIGENNNIEDQTDSSAGDSETTTMTTFS